MENKKDQIAQMIADIELQPIFFEDEQQLDEYKKFPMEQLNALGVAFHSVTEFITGCINYSNNGNGGIAKIHLPEGIEGTHLKNFKKDITRANWKFGGVYDADNHLVDQAGIEFIGPSFDPTNLCMAIALMNINQKMDDIQETQKEILAFLEEQEQAKLKGNLNVLADILNNYKYNWNNSTYKSHKHIQVQEIKRDAEQSLIFHRSQIEKILRKKSLIHTDENVNQKMQQAESGYKDYQLSLYMYAFSAFLEVMFLENFENGYLKNVSKKIEDYAKQYTELYQKAYTMIEEYAKTSLQTQATKLWSGINKGIGTLVSKIPLLNKSQIDENLLANGEKLEQIIQDRVQNTMQTLFNGAIDFVKPFLDNIYVVNKLYNNPLEILISKDTLYVK